MWLRSVFTPSSSAIIEAIARFITGGGSASDAPVRIAKWLAVSEALFSGNCVATTTSLLQAMPQSPMEVGNSEKCTIVAKPFFSHKSKCFTFFVSFFVSGI
eukprot:TRINITY_DN147077_c0_g1_i1.p2 TRINITY_DN147077_c0_g1~~TRINITY_DN147077_c0_g1_i1.p2  ORF type:complete len:101 (+),score=8.31 TRINITY_DN147077_c0_g1_i1:55-357(+)